MSTAAGRGDRLRLEVFQHLFAAACEEMGEALMRSAFSSNVKERRDFSCALFDREGRMIAQAAHLPVHLGSTPLSVRAAIETTRMERGDAVCLNDPYLGGTHLPDVTLVSPVFLGEDSASPAFYVAGRAHHADIGGAAPGSMAPAADVHGEGLRVPPVRLVRGGAFEEDLLRLFLANTRVASEREGDLRAQWAANLVGVRRLEELARENGAEALAGHASGLMDWTEEIAREALNALPRGRVEAEDYLELEHEEGQEDEARLHLVLEVRDDGLVFDFRGTDDQVASGVNTTRAVTVSAVFYVLRLLLGREAPTNDGLLRIAEIRTRVGSVVDARYPAAVAAGNVETSQRLVDVLLTAFGVLRGGVVPAQSAGTMTNVTFGARSGTEEAPFTYYETLGGGAGGGPAGPGAHALQTHMTNTRNTPIEALEQELPVRVIETTVRRGSGGKGANEGGDGIRRRFRFLAPAHAAWIADRQRRGPAGSEGGEGGTPGRIAIREAGEDEDRRQAGKAARDLEAGSELSVETPGGGGYGESSDE